MSTHTREPMRDSAFAWATEQIPKFVYACNRRRVSNTSHIEYHVMVDGIVWTDEFPEVTSDLRTTMQKSFCVLIHLRTSVILGLKQAIACLSESDFRSAAATEPAGLV